jgi:hypothetical protein
MWKHLSTCENLVDPHVRVTANQHLEVYDKRQADKLAQKARNANPAASGATQISDPFAIGPISDHGRTLSPLASPSLGPSLSFSTPSAVPITPSPLSASWSSSSLDSPARPPAKRPRLGTEPINSEVFYAEVGVPPDQWTAAHRQEWMRDMCLLLIACNISWWAVEHPYWRAFSINGFLAAWFPDGNKSQVGF